MQFYVAAWLGLGSIKSALLALCTAAPSASAGTHRPSVISGQLLDESPMTWQPASVLSPISGLSSGANPANTGLGNSHRRQVSFFKSRKAVSSPAAKAEGPPTTGAVQTTQASQRLRSQVVVPLLPQAETSVLADASDADTANHFNNFSFLQKVQQNVVLLTLVGSCIVLILILACIITHYMSSKHRHERRGATRETVHPYESSQCTFLQHFLKLPKS